jgi:SAM-dependent methyltransferase
MQSANRFGGAFYRSIAAGSSRAAEAIAPLVNGLLPARSVVDFGCGTGAWLRAFRRCGAVSVLGLDQFEPTDVALLIERDEYQRADLAQDIRLVRRFDLALSLEVGEHLPRPASPTLVANLVNASDRILFSAATPGQGGVHHINERPLWDWVELFAERGYAASDFVRPLIARHRLKVEPWYRYNTLFFFRRSAAASLPAAVTDCVVSRAEELARPVPVAWRLRGALLSLLPRPAVTLLASGKHRVRALFGD